MISWIRTRFHPLWHLRKTKWFLALQRKYDFPITAKSGKIRYSVMCLRDFSHVIPHTDDESRTRECFVNILKQFQPEYFLDVGANVGSYSWKAINQNPRLKTWLFEPDQTNVTLLHATIERNHLALACVYPVAVSAKKGQAEFLLDEASGATGTINHSSDSFPLHSQYRMQRRVQVDSDCLDSYVDELIGSKVVVKIDVEGAEDQVLSGATRLLESVRPIILLECFNSDKMSILRNFNYRIHNLEEGCNWLAAPAEHWADIAACFAT